MSSNIKEQDKSTSEKNTPAYLYDDYPYQAVGEAIADLDKIKPDGVLYEIKCTQCGMSIRAQGDKVKYTYQQLMNGNGCIGCGNKNLVIHEINMNAAK